MVAVTSNLIQLICLSLALEASCFNHGLNLTRRPDLYCKQVSKMCIQCIVHLIHCIKLLYNNTRPGILCLGECNALINYQS